MTRFYSIIDSATGEILDDGFESYDEAVSEAEGYDVEVFIGFDDYEDELDDGMTDVEADADALKNIGWGTDEDYGCFGDDCYNDF